MGDSDTPLLRYSTSEMAKDVIELVDHLGWTGERELHIVGVSMGGMISQELVHSPPIQSQSPPTKQPNSGLPDPQTHLLTQSPLHGCRHREYNHVHREHAHAHQHVHPQISRPRRDRRLARTVHRVLARRQRHIPRPAGRDPGRRIPRQGHVRDVRDELPALRGAGDQQAA